MNTAPRYSFVITLELEPTWLALSRAERMQHAARVQEIVARRPQVSFRWFDADAFGSGYSDFVICECDDVEQYHFLWEELRDTPLFSTPYLRIRGVMLGMERGYQRYEADVAAARTP